MPRVELRLEALLHEKLLAAKPTSLSMPAFCSLLIEQTLDKASNLPAYRVGAGKVSNPKTESEHQPATTTGLASGLDVLSTREILEDGVGKGLLGGTPRKEPLTSGEGYKPQGTASNPVQVPAAKLGVVRAQRAKGSPEFEAFWKQYQAIKRRASSQSKPKALEVWNQLVPGIEPDQLRRALTKAVQQQLQQERDGGFGSPFPDCFRWLRDGYFEAFLDGPAAAVPPAVSTRPIFDPNNSDDPF